MITQSAFLIEMKEALFLSVIACIAILVGAVSFFENRKVKARFMRRSEISPIEQLREMDGSKNLDLDGAVALWQEISNCVGVPSGKLRANDRFDVEFRGEKGNDFDGLLSALNVILEKRKRDMKLDVDLSGIQTLSDCLNAFCRR